MAGSEPAGDGLKIAFICDGDPEDATTWSGIPFHMLRALERRGEIAHVVRAPWPWWYRPVGRALKGLSGRRWHYDRSPWFVGLAARKAIRELAACEFDVVYAVSTPIVAALARHYPVVPFADATLVGMHGYYAAITAYGPGTVAAARRLEQQSFDRSLLVSFPSEWATASARGDYGVPDHKLLQVAWGANLSERPTSSSKRLQAGEGVRILFVGVDWPRKGGEIALDTVRRLRERGLDAHLDVIGCDAAVLAGPVPDFATFHGFLNKNREDDRAVLASIYCRAALFLMPTQAEAWGIVFAEAAHHALPVAAYATGGVTSVVRAGETGLLLPMDADGERFAEAIGALLADGEAYAAMSAAALEDARARLDWDVWAATVSQAVRTRLASAEA